MAQICVCTTLLLTLLAAEQAAGQSALERLEREIRNRLAAPATGAPKGTPTTKEASGIPTPAKTDRQAGPLTQAYFGVATADALDRGRGVRVTEVAPGSPAQAAGIQPGDLLTGLGGVRIRSQEDYDEIMSEVRPGMTLTVELLRGKEPHKVNVTFARPNDVRSALAAPSGNAKAKPGGGNPPPVPPTKTGTGHHADDQSKFGQSTPPAPKIPPPPAELPKAGPQPQGPAKVLGAEPPVLIPPETKKSAAPADRDNLEARLSALEARFRQLEERIARLEETLRQAQAPKANP